MYKIEKGVERSGERRGRGRGRIYPFEEMEIGDSFLVSYKDVSNPSSLQMSILACARSRKKLPNGFKVTTSADNSGVRCWRIK